MTGRETGALAPSVRQRTALVIAALAFAAPLAASLQTAKIDVGVGGGRAIWRISGQQMMRRALRLVVSATTGNNVCRDASVGESKWAVRKGVRPLERNTNATDSLIVPRSDIHTWTLV